jgi:hypothetical protein
VPTTPAPRANLGARARSANDVSAVSGRDEGGEQPACFSGESNDSHAEHQEVCCHACRIYFPFINLLRVVALSPPGPPQSSECAACMLRWRQHPGAEAAADGARRQRSMQAAARGASAVCMPRREAPAQCACRGASMHVPGVVTVRVLLRVSGRVQGRAVAVGEMTEQEQEELRLRRIQEKNRRNQRKFRARQRVRLFRPLLAGPTPQSAQKATSAIVIAGGAPCSIALALVLCTRPCVDAAKCGSQLGNRKACLGTMRGDSHHPWLLSLSWHDEGQ